MTPSAPPTITPALKFIQPATEQKPVFTLLLKGAPGTRKTTLALQFPRPYVFSFDRNLNPVRWLTPEQRAQISVCDPFHDMITGELLKNHAVWNNFVKQLEAVLQIPGKFTVVIDSISTLSEILLDKIQGTDSPEKRVTQAEWGDAARYWRWLGDMFLKANDLDKNVIMIGHESIERDKDGAITGIALNMGGKMKTQFDLYFTDSWRTYVVAPIAGEQQYRVRVQPQTGVVAKCSLLGLPADFEWKSELKKILEQVQ